MARLFVAVRLPLATERQMDLIPRDEQPGVRYVPPQNWHITLRFLGDADPSMVAQALSGIQSRSTRVRIGPVVTSFGDGVVILPVAGLDELAAEVARRSTGLGSEPMRNRFLGHVTLARVRPGHGLPHSMGTPFVDEFDVIEIELVRSHFEAYGVRYETVGRWRIREDWDETTPLLGPQGS